MTKHEEMYHAVYLRALAYKRAIEIAEALGGGKLDPEVLIMLVRDILDTEGGGTGEVIDDLDFYLDIRHDVEAA